MGIAAIEFGLRLAYDVLHTVHDTGLPRWLSDSPLFFWFSWSVGAFVAELHLRGKCPVVRSPALWVLCVVSVACWFIKPLSSMTFPLCALLTAGIVIKLLENPGRSLPMPTIVSDHLQKVGIWSFSLYLLHQPLVFGEPVIAGKLTSGAYIHPLLMFALCLASWVIIVPLSRLSFQYLEVPSIAFGKRFYLQNAAPRVA